MKKQIFTLAIISLFVITGLARENMVIHLKNGQQQKISVENVDSITFQTVVEQQHEYVDLGLPSGTLWATMNVGAQKPEDYGNYYAWGETEPKETYNWSTYKWGTEKSLKKYNGKGSLGTVDNLKELLPEDDAATANWGEGWCTPSDAQYNELFMGTTVTWTFEQQNGVWGYCGESKTNGNKIFFPAAGSKTTEVLWSEKLNGKQSYGRYHTRNVYTVNSVYYDDVYYWFNCTPKAGTTGGYRCDGKSIRPVKTK